jgi:hypothetical protein
MTSDRRNPATPDRRAQTFSGRRITDPQPAHGTRACYKRGCTCTPCKAAEAAYRADLRLKRLKGLPVLGVLVSPVEARRRIRQLKTEGYPETRIASMAGWADGRARHVQLGAARLIRFFTLRRIQKVADFAMLEGTDGAADL